jgi:hypothetical protein
VSFRNYNAFLRAFQNGEVKRLVIVARLNVNLSGQSTVQSGNLSLELWSSGGCPLIAKSAFMLNMPR